jgi:hypothetical protein
MQAFALKWQQSSRQHCNGHMLYRSLRTPIVVVMGIPQRHSFRISECRSYAWKSSNSSMNISRGVCDARFSMLTASNTPSLKRSPESRTWIYGVIPNTRK